MGGHQGGPEVGPPRARVHPEDGEATGRPLRGDLRRGAALGLRRHRARDLGLVARRGRHRLLGHARADRPVGARVLRHRRRDQARRLRRHRGGRGLRRQVAAHHREARRRRVGPQRHQGLHLERRHRRRHVVVATVDPELGHRGQASFVVPKGTPGLSQGKKEDKIGIRASQTAEVVLEDCRIPVDYLLGGMDKLEKKLERARSGQSTGGASARSPPSRSPARWSAPRRSASPRRRTSGRSSTSRTKVVEGSRCSSSSASSRCWPTWPPRSRPRGCSCGAPPGWAQRHPDDRRPGLDVEAEGRAT